MMAGNELQGRIQSIRRFNRFYTKQIGLLNRGLLETKYPLIHARIIFELAQQKETTAGRLIREMSIDPGYLSRVLKALERAGLVRAARSRADSRRRMLKLSAAGRKAFSVLNRRSSDQAKALLQACAEADQQRLVDCMRTIEHILDPEAPRAPATLRTHRPGDIGWIAHRHGVVYAGEYGWDETFEALVAEILVNFIKKHNPQRERLWIAEQEGEPVGSVMLVDAGNNVSQLRLLLVEPQARGQGLGKKLIEKCIEFSRRKGYRRMKLWTQSNLSAARHLYAQLGWQLTDETPNRAFGKNLVSEIWELNLSQSPRSRGV
jgi:DNA-binding MarR family transcriptional regulator/N-acetylglutamate synthase-like GNAT family acetyltransferase